MPLVFNGVASYIGCVLEFDESYGWAYVWDENTQSIRDIRIRGWVGSGHATAEVDATEQVRAKAQRWRETENAVENTNNSIRNLPSINGDMVCEVVRGKKVPHGIYPVYSHFYNSLRVNVRGRNQDVPAKYVRLHVDVSQVRGQVACRRCRNVYESILHPDMSYPRAGCGGDWSTGKLTIPCMSRLDFVKLMTICKHCYLAERRQLPVPDVNWKGPGLINHDDPTEVEFAKDILSSRTPQEMLPPLLIFADYLCDTGHEERAEAIREACGTPAKKRKLTYTRVSGGKISVSGFTPFYCQSRKANADTVMVHIAPHAYRKVRFMAPQTTEGPGYTSEIPTKLAETIRVTVRELCVLPVGNSETK